MKVVCVGGCVCEWRETGASEGSGLSDERKALSSAMGKFITANWSNAAELLS